MESVIGARLKRPPAKRPPAPRASRASLLGGLRARAVPSRRALLVALLAAALLAGGFLLFRNSSFVSVQRVEIIGVRGIDAAPISQALDTAAQRMSTMDYGAGPLQAAVAQYPVVRSLKVTTSFPHTMRILVEEQLPVARLSANGVQSAVAANGVVLGASPAAGSLPTLRASAIPAVGRRVGAARLRSYLTVLGAAPAPLLPLVSNVFMGQQGLTIKMSNGLLVYFGDASRPHAKWDSLVTVLADSGSVGAGYIDVRLPERPAAGVPSGGVGSGESAQVSASDPTAAVLAASLARAVNGESTASVSTPSAEAQTPSTEAQTPSAEANASTEAQAASQSSLPGSSEAASAEGGSEAQAGGAEGVEATAEGG